MRTQIHVLMLACAICAAAPALRAKTLDCTPSRADSRMTPEQQKAAADGYRMACESVNAYNKRMAGPKPAAQLDEVLPDLYFPPVKEDATMKDYQHWLYIEQDSCPRLVTQVRASLPGYTTHAGKITFLKTIETLVTQKGACE